MVVFPIEYRNRMVSCLQVHEIIRQLLTLSLLVLHKFNIKVSCCWSSSKKFTYHIAYVSSCKFKSNSSLMEISNYNGPILDRCGTPDNAGYGFEVNSLKDTNCSRLVRSELRETTELFAYF